MLAGEILNGPVRCLQGRNQGPIRRIGIAGQVGGPYRLDRNGAGKLATLVAAHAIGDDDEPALAAELLVAFRLRVAVVVLVVGAMTAHVSKVAQLDAGPDLHPCSCRYRPGHWFRRTAENPHDITGT